MSGYNRVVLMGNLTRDPELKQTPQGRPVADLGLATNESYKDQAGKVVERVCFVDVVTWGRQAETCCQYLAKGRPVLIEGRLQLDQWKNDRGENRSKLRVRADRVQFLSAGKRAGQGSADQPDNKEDEEGNGDAMPF